jgi:hypothetical protein
MTSDGTACGVLGCGPLVAVSVSTPASERREGMSGEAGRPRPRSQILEHHPTVTCRSCVPRREGSSERRRSSYFDGPRTERVPPLDLSEVPTRERKGFVDDDDQFFFSPGMLLADLGIAPIDQQPTAVPARGKRRIVETDKHPSARKAFTIKVVVHPRPQHDARMSVLRLQLGPRVLIYNTTGADATWTGITA